MENWGNYYESNKDGENRDSLKSASFYTENYRKKKSRRFGIVFQMIIVAVISSILGGVVVGSFFVYAAPKAQALMEGLQDKNYSSGSLSPDTGSKSNNSLSSGNNNYQSASNTEKVLLPAEQYETIVSVVAEMVSPSIVGIRSIPKQRSYTSSFEFFFFGEQQASPSEGSGIIISSDGYILTNHHVISNVIDNMGQMTDGAKIEVYLPNQMDKPYEATIVDWDRKTDLAVLKIDASELPEAKLGDSDKLKVGEIAIAIGNPGGLEYMGSVTSGVISGLNRKVIVEDRELRLIQTDAAINPGNSGGALVNARGEVIGVNTVKMASVEYEGLGFAIPINTAKEIAESLINKTPIAGREPVLGVRIDTRYSREVAEAYDMPVGLWVLDVTFMSGAHKAGIRSGDIIIEFDGQPVESFDELQELKNKHKPGDTVKVKIFRNKQYLELDVTLSEDRG
ncbi:MAG TPA: PDZ domain-containing protein [Clostridiaceae bacterium]|nr:PDZ domain-containing protein [Clostridiaceae bacterium]